MNSAKIPASTTSISPRHDKTRADFPMTTIQRTENFFTERLQLAIYLHASERLPFLRCDSQASGKIRFVFDDSGGTGSQIELEFDRGAAIAASDLFASQKFLRRKMSEAIDAVHQRRIENSEYEQNRKHCFKSTHNH